MTGLFAGKPRFYRRTRSRAGARLAREGVLTNATKKGPHESPCGPFAFLIRDQCLLSSCDIASSCFSWFQSNGSSFCSASKRRSSSA
ncbi:hypothetical protein FQ192_19205 [Pseudomonas sp. ANT_J12]|nr:hypothetical protein FQ192_19205 [Pseudomonas sp. ANT_J12]